MIDIEQGATFQGRSSYLGVPFMALGFLTGTGAALNNWIWLLLALPLFAIGLVIFMVRKGTVIDPIAKRFQPYQDFLLFKAGPWIPVDGISTVRVKRERETYSHDPNGAGIIEPFGLLVLQCDLARDRARESGLPEGVLRSRTSACLGPAIGRSAATHLGRRDPSPDDPPAQPTLTERSLP